MKDWGHPPTLCMVTTKSFVDGSVGLLHLINVELCKQAVGVSIQERAHVATYPIHVIFGEQGELRAIFYCPDGREERYDETRLRRTHRCALRRGVTSVQDEWDSECGTPSLSFTQLCFYSGLQQSCGGVVRQIRVSVHQRTHVQVCGSRHQECLNAPACSRREGAREGGRTLRRTS